MFASGVLLFSVFAASHAFVHNVVVGDQNGALTYTPSVTTAKPGDFINFIFSPKNHTVTQSSFDDPCTPLQGGFSSGFHPVAANLTTDFPVFTIPVVNSNPIWFHCEQGAGTNASHCAKGMVGAINPSAAKTFDAFMQKALNSSTQADSSSSKAYSGSNGAPTIHHVNVSDLNGDLAYYPPVTSANPGDIVRFLFFPKNHTVTQSSFDDPCSAISGGLDSGFKPVTSAAANFTFDITVKDNNPIWLYCQQGAHTSASHCGKGMVAAINPTPQKTFDAFRAKALQIGATLSAPSQPIIHEVTVSDANGDLAYSPPVTNANPGEIVRFTFFPKNHTVTQSSFDDPCSPIASGFTSGFRPVTSVPDAHTAANVTFEITVQDTNPIWLHCEQGANTNASHCGKGMVAAINPSADKTFDVFKAKALQIGASLAAPSQTTPTIHYVNVSDANGDLAYYPPVTNATPGDTVRFLFFPKNHTVTQSSFDDPCTALPNGFNSGFKPVTSAAANFTFDVAVNDTSPIWLYCQQGGHTNASHCGKGMVAAINPTADKTFDAFRFRALQVGFTEGAVTADQLYNYTPGN